MANIRRNSNKSRNRKKKILNRVNSSRLRKRQDLVSGEYLEGEKAAFALFEAYSHSQSEFDELVREYRELELKEPAKRIFDIDLNEIWNGVQERSFSGLSCEFIK